MFRLLSLLILGYFHKPCQHHWQVAERGPLTSGKYSIGCWALLICDKCGKHKYWKGS